MPATLRFAPSPNGPLHLGHALSALLGHRLARRLGGHFLLRIEDIDPARSRPEHVAGILQTMRWLEIDCDGVPLHQSGNFAAYRAAASKLAEFGLLYPCFATRAEIQRASALMPGCLRYDPDGAPLHPGRQRVLSQVQEAQRASTGQPYALRLDMARALALSTGRMQGAQLTHCAIDAAGRRLRMPARPERWGDVVLVRKDTPTSYHLSVVVDDAAQGVTHVTRGRDLEAATDLHRLLQVLLDLPEPMYHHHRLLLDTDGAKLAKSKGAPALADLAAAGLGASDVRAMLDIEANVERMLAGFET